MRIIIPLKFKLRGPLCFEASRVHHIMETWENIIQPPVLASLFASDTAGADSAPAPEPPPHIKLQQIAERANAAASGSGEAPLALARGLVALCDSILSTLQSEPATPPDSIIQLALVDESLSACEARKIFTNPEDQASLAALRQRSQALLTQWQEQKRFEKTPLDHIRPMLPPVVEVLNRVQTLLNERLFIHPDHADAVLKDRKELAEKSNSLRQREIQCLEAWRALEGEKKKPGFTDEKNKEQELCEKAVDLVQERKTLDQEVANRESQYPSQPKVGWLDARRKPVFEAFDKNSIDVELVKERRGILNVRLKMLDEELAKAEKRIPDFFRDEANGTVNALLWPLSQMLKFRGDASHHPLLEQKDLYEAPFRKGSLYFETVREVEEILGLLQNYLDDHGRQTHALQEIKNLAKQGNVFLAEKRMAKIERRFKDISYRRIDEAIQEALRPFRETQRLSADVDAYAAKRKTFWGKIFKDNEARQKLDNQISSARSQVSRLQKCELKSAVNELCDKLEASLRV